jgi:OFA family oxalate/formate antiporter-like MFS transporter
MIGGILFGLGTILGGLGEDIGSIHLLWLGYGVIGGIGNGLGYITPIAVLVRWFPEKKGFITGLAVMGFGLGAAFMSMFGQWMIESCRDGNGVHNTFYICGVVFLIGIVVAARKLVNPPPGYAPAAAPGKKPAPAAIASVDLKTARSMPQLYLLWGMLFLNVVAGIAIISNLSPMATGGLPKLAAGAAAMIVTAGSFFNGFGRLFWGTLSEKIGRRNVFLLLFLTQIPLFILLPHVSNGWIFAVIACYILLCYGGGFGTMPSFTADTFGPKNVGAIYGVVLFAWGVAGGVGPSLMEWISKTTHTFDLALYIAAGALAIGFVLSLLYRKPKLQ